jgi:RNA polymerase sigma factor (sigma-70 family)
MSTESKVALAPILRILASSRGDEEAWRALFLQLWPYVMALNFRFLRGHIDLAEDASQDAMIRLARFCPFEKLIAEETFRAYVRTVCRNVSRSYMRRLATRQEVGLEELDLHRSQAVPSDEAPDGELLARELLGSSFAKLDADDRQLFTLLVSGSPAGEITEVTGLARGSIYVRVHRLRQKLRKLLREGNLWPTEHGFGFDSASKK